MQKRIISVCEQHEAAGGAPQSTLEAALGAEDQQAKMKLMESLNPLLQSGKVIMSQTHDRKLVFRVQGDEEAARLHGLESADRLVYQEISNAASAGIASKDLRIRLNMQAPALTKILKTLETRRLVKKVKSVTAKNKVLYMLADIEASKEVTGGAFYSDTQKFDHELVEQLQTVALRYIASRERCTAKQVLDFIIANNVLVQSTLAVADIESILEALVYDAKLEVVFDPGSMYSGKKEGAKYRVSSMETNQPMYTSVPCSACPVFNDCTKGGDVSPETCSYLTRWVDHAAQLAW